MSGPASVFRQMAGSSCDSRALLFSEANVNLWELNYMIHHGNRFVDVAVTLFKLLKSHFMLFCRG